MLILIYYPVIHLQRLGISDQTKRRVLVYKNGCGNKGFEIVASIDKFEDVSN